MLTGKKILLGVCGGIAAYKMCMVVRLLKKAGAEVRVVMTPSATQFVAPLTFSTLTQEEVLVSLWPESVHASTQAGVRHIDLGLWADCMVIAPATANTIAKLALGLADSALTSIALALRAPLIVAPAMDVDMYAHPAVQQNVSTLRQRGAFILPPERGSLASGLSGEGRLPEPETIVEYVSSVLMPIESDLQGKRILISAGPTYEPIDPVRFIGNRSSGKMGFALARAAVARGAIVTLVTGPVSLPTPQNVTRVDVETARQMHDVMLRLYPDNDLVIMAAAVADYTPAAVEPTKIKKQKSGTDLLLELKSTTDILRELGARKHGVIVGFALETDNELAHAQEKLRKKNCDMIVLNSINDEGAGFGTETNVVTLVKKDGSAEKLPLLSKDETASRILDAVVQLLRNSLQHQEHAHQ
ncbi:MAG TPA: bifunctional phosphopantothenoylcysteine decarboxylase/phosphopantothenate--cysteine ligase CoaBC [Bacteroidota bacterium]|nr:bifunctional phosphopantothenoylcysteine decarboxylase/phosphopantothenate--cysteine ligase CoaBC [Bacteroidota bacterium]